MNSSKSKFVAAWALVFCVLSGFSLEAQVTSESREESELFETVPPLINVPIVTTTDLQGVRILVHDSGLDRVIQHLVLDMQYVRRGEEIVLAHYFAVSETGRIIEVREPSEPGDVPVEQLQEIERGNPVFLQKGELPEGMTVPAFVERSIDRVPEEGQEAPVLRQRTDGDAPVVPMTLIKATYRTDENGILRVESMTGKSIGPDGITLHVLGRPGSTGITAVRCPWTRTFFCRDICFGRCSSYPSCNCGGFGFCTRASWVSCYRPSGACSGAPRCRVKPVFVRCFTFFGLRICIEVSDCVC